MAPIIPQALQQKRPQVPQRALTVSQKKNTTQNNYIDNSQNIQAQQEQEQAIQEQQQLIQEQEKLQQEQQAQYQRELAAYNKARSMGLDKARSYVMRDGSIRDPLVSKYIKDLYGITRKQLTNREYQAIEKADRQAIVEQKLAILKTASELGISTKGNDYNKLVTEINKQQIAPKTISPITKQVITQQENINPITNKPYGTITESKVGKIQRFSEKVGLAGLYASISSSIEGTKQIITSPKQTAIGAVKFGKGLIKGTEDFSNVGLVIRTQPDYAAGYILGEIGSAYVGSKFTKLGGKAITQVGTRLDPRYVAATSKGIALSDDLKIGVAGPLSEIKEPLSKQVRLTGKTITPVSAQRNLFGLFKSEVKIQKPIPDEALLKPSTRELLKKFDEGTLSKSQIETLNKKVIEETGSKGLLERSFFADPYSRVRYSRLDVAPESNKLFDYFTEDITFKKSKPQIVYLKDAPVENIPKIIKDKLSRGEALTIAEKDILLKLQLERTGKLKPIGFISTEPEVTIAPGEVLRKKRTSGVTLINGKKVEIIEAEIKKQAQDVTKKGRISSFLQRKTPTVSYNYPSIQKKYVSPYSALGYPTSQLIKAVPDYNYKRGSNQYDTYSKKIQEYTSNYKPVSKYDSKSTSPISSDYTFSYKPESTGSTSPVITSPQITSPISKGTSYSSQSYLTGVTPKTPKPKESQRFTFPEEKKKQDNKPYDAQVYVDATRKQKARWITVANNVPLVTALSKGGQYVDETASNRFRVVPQKGKMSRVMDTAWNSLQSKFREYTQKGGVKVGLRPRNYLEKRSARIDSPGERRAIPQQGQASISRRFGRL